MILIGQIAQLLSMFSGVTNAVEQTSRYSSLSDTDKKLYRKIVKDVFKLYTTQEPGLDSSKHTQCALFFRQSKSWKDIEKRLEIDDVKDEKTVQWISDWQTRIQAMREIQNEIFEKDKILEQEHKNLNKIELSEKEKNICKKNINSISQFINEKTKNIKILVSEGGEKLKTTNPENFPSCKSVIKYMKNNWLELTVFSEWTEICLDEEILAVKIARQKNQETIPFDSILNSSTRALYIIDELEAEQKTVSGEKMTNPTKLGVKTRHFLEETQAQTSTKRSSSEIRIVESHLYNRTGFAYEVDKTEDMLATTIRLERVVTLALNKVNEKLNTYKNDPSIFPEQSDTEEERTAVYSPHHMTFIFSNENK